MATTPPCRTRTSDARRIAWESCEPVNPCTTTKTRVRAPVLPTLRRTVVGPHRDPVGGDQGRPLGAGGGDGRLTWAILPVRTRAMTPSGPSCVFATATAPRQRRDERSRHGPPAAADQRRSSHRRRCCPPSACCSTASRWPRPRRPRSSTRPPADAVLVDGRRDLPHIRSLCRLLRTTGVDCPVLLVVTEGGLAAVTAEWGVDDVLLDTAGPAEVEARLRLAQGRLASESRRGRARGDPQRRRRHRRGELHRPRQRSGPRPHLQGVRAPQVPRAAPGPGLHPRPAAAGGLGLRLLRRHPHRRRPRTAAARQARHRARVLIGTVRNVGYRFVAQPATSVGGRRRPTRASTALTTPTRRRWSVPLTSAPSPRPAAAERASR